MAMNESLSSDSSRTPIIKKPYEKPAFRYEQVFVTTALACGKIATVGSCLSQNSAS